MIMTADQWDEAVNVTMTSGVDIKGSVDKAAFAGAIVDDGAHPTSRCMQAHELGLTEYAQRMIIGGQAVICYWLFDEDEMAEAGDDEGNLPWDLSHVDRIETAG